MAGCALNVWVEWTKRGVSGVRFVKEQQTGRLPYNLQTQLARYFAGKPVRVHAPLDLEDGTAFQRKVWRALRRIPFGQTRSYAWVARRIGCPRATRAVGTACAEIGRAHV